MAAYFDKLAPGWIDSPGEHAVCEKLVSMMELPANSVIADIGCGRGVMFPHLLKTNPAKIIAVDISAEMLRLAKERQDARITCINGDFLEAPLPARALDAAVFYNSYPHFLNKEALVEKLAQTVKQNGRVIIAHSRPRAAINGVHKNRDAFVLSAPLESAGEEAQRFFRFFAAETLIDNEEIYFVKMRRIQK
jgi:demethylmenaquinone methyltransferase/2-methoxy-6-polyprenyl-1,4-benzoquinol methylase